MGKVPFKFYAKNENDLESISKSFVKLFNEHQIFAFYGDMGVGKTTFISYLAKAINVKDKVNSPTFGYVNEYISTDYGSIYHFDLYRIESEEEAYDIGIEEYLYGDALVFIEWAEKIANILPDNYVKVIITKDEQEGREIEIEL